MDALDQASQEVIFKVMKELDRELDRIGLYDVNTEFGVVVPVAAGFSEEEGSLAALDVAGGEAVVIIDCTRLISGDIAWSDEVLNPAVHRMAQELEDESDDKFLERLDEVLDDGWEDLE